jgi:hypothetical protein
MYCQTWVELELSGGISLHQFYLGYKEKPMTSLKHNYNPFQEVMYLPLMEQDDYWDPERNFYWRTVLVLVAEKQGD